jgi:hypothetical protein
MLEPCPSSTASGPPTLSPFRYALLCLEAPGGELRGVSSNPHYAREAREHGRSIRLDGGRLVAKGFELQKEIVARHVGSLSRGADEPGELRAQLGWTTISAGHAFMLSFDIY